MNGRTARVVRSRVSWRRKTKPIPQPGEPGAEHRIQVVHARGNSSTTEPRLRGARIASTGGKSNSALSEGHSSPGGRSNRPPRGFAGLTLAPGTRSKRRGADHEPRAAAILWVPRGDRARCCGRGALAGHRRPRLGLTFSSAAGMDTAVKHGHGRRLLMPMPWTLATFRVMLVMWIVIDDGDDAPEARRPMILLFATIKPECARKTGTPYATGPSSLSPIWALWAAFSIAATWRAMGDWNMQGCCLRPWQPPAPPWAGGRCSCLAGVYQTYAAETSLPCGDCRSPPRVPEHHTWQGGALGAFRMGLRHGLFFASAAAGP